MGLLLCAAFKDVSREKLTVPLHRVYLAYHVAPKISVEVALQGLKEPPSTAMKAQEVEMEYTEFARDV